MRSLIFKNEVHVKSQVSSSKGNHPGKKSDRCAVYKAIISWDPDWYTADQHCYKSANLKKKKIQGFRSKKFRIPDEEKSFFRFLCKKKVIFSYGFYFFCDDGIRKH